MLDIKDHAELKDWTFNVQDIVNCALEKNLNRADFITLSAALLNIYPDITADFVKAIAPLLFDAAKQVYKRNTLGSRKLFDNELRNQLDRDKFMPAITLTEAKALTYRDTIYMRHYTNSDGSAIRARVNGQVKIWKRDPNRVRVPLKHGLWEYGYLEEHNLTDFSLVNLDW